MATRLPDPTAIRPDGGDPVRGRLGVGAGQTRPRPRGPLSREHRPSGDTLDIVLDKGRFAEAMERLGVAHPYTQPIETVDDLASFSDTALTGMFLKPRISWAFQRRYGVKGFRCATRAEAIERVRQAQQIGLALVLQAAVMPTTGPLGADLSNGLSILLGY